MKLSNVFVGMPRWNRPTHEANRDAILAGTAKCICVPSTATRVVVEMWGQGGGGAPAACCTTGIYGGQGGSYSNKVFTGAISPSSMGTCMLFCGCVCTCDCMTMAAGGVAICGHNGQFAWLRNCNTVGAMAGWYGCTTGGLGGVPYCEDGWFNRFCYVIYCQPAIRFGSLPTNSEYNVLCLDIDKKTKYGIFSMSLAGNSSILGGSQLCCAAASCFCATTLQSVTNNGFQIFSNSELQATIHQNNNSLNTIFRCTFCTCFDNYKLGACGFTDFNEVPNNFVGIIAGDRYSMIGVGGASYAGGHQQYLHSAAWGVPSKYQGYAGFFPGGGGKSSSACVTTDLICGSIGGAGLIIISWN